MANDNDDKGTAAEATICVKCKYRRAKVLGNDKCGKNPYMDYVTGELEEWLCSAKNKGQCADYEEWGE
jgi:hypothetical protein